ncbi:hypothetical protein EVA_17728 [gut metagenome]|uniref:Uncharacterized protein n=1 Tax=gut metagenome TaxID=749906 RepID=J9C2X9_9ZZZZ
MEVKGHAHRFRLFLLLHPLQNIQKTINGMGIQAIPVGQRPYSEVSPVDDAVSV